MIEKVPKAACLLCFQRNKSPLSQNRLQSYDYFGSVQVFERKYFRKNV